MNKLNPIKYIENMISHHPKSISLWITEGIVINGERYIIKEFRLRDGSLYAVIAENKYTPKYFEVKLAPDEETLKDIYKAIEENKLAIEKEVTDRKNEIARVDTAIKANTTKIEQEIADRKSEIARVDKAIEANTEKINQEITDRQNEITRVDNAINANTAKIDKEIQDRKNEITRVDGAIHANTEKINQEITDRTNEINRVDGKLTDLEGKLTTSDGKIAELDKATKDNKAKIDQEIIDRKREIDRVDEATKANKATIDQEIANRRDEINRVDQAVAANTAKINKEISDRQNEISRVDGAINANTAKINKEIQDRKGEITRVEGSISANTAKIDKEITDRKSEIACVEGKIPTSIGVRNLWIQSKATGSFTEETLPDNHITGQKKCYRITNNNELSFSIEPNFSPRLYRKVTLSAWVKYENVVQGTNNWNVFNCFKHSLYYKNSSTGATTNANYLTLEGFTGTSDWKYITYTHDYSENKSYDQLKTSIRFNLESARSGTAWVTGIKIELGSIPSDYTPSSEDVESLIAQKQDKLTAGKGIAIQGNVISATVDSTPQHDTQKEQVLASTRSTITITHGANGTSETTKVDTNPAKVLEHDNLLTDNGISKTTSGNTTKLGLEYRRVDGGRFDLNNLVNGKVRASDFVNAPSTGWLFVSSYNEGSYAIQRAVKLVDNNNISYVRRKDAGSWGAWREQAGDKSVIDTAISANTTKINQEIQDRKNEITRVEGKIPTNVSTRNLILKSNDFANPHKATGDNTTVTSTNGYFVIRSTGYTANVYGGMSWNMSISEVKAGEEFSILMPVYIDSSVPMDNGWSFNLKNHSSNLVAYDYSIPTNKKDEWFNVAITFKAYKDVVFNSYPFYVYIVKNGLVRIKPPMLVRGSLIPSDYQSSPEDYDSKLVSVKSEIKQTTDTISARVTSLDSSTVKNSSLTINADGTVMKAGKTTTDIANAIGSYFAVNQNAVNKFSDRINVKTAMIADGAVTSAKIAREITLDMLTCGKIKNTNEITVFDLNTGTLKFSNNSGRIQRAYRDKVIEITDYITSTSGSQDYATSAFVVRKSDNSKQAAVKLTLDNTKAEATITSDLFYVSDSKSKMLFSVDRTNNVKPDWGDIPIAHVLGGLVANDISIGGRSKSLLKIVDELCKKSGITWS